MEVALKSPKPGAATAVNRRTRISIPVIISGKDMSGQPFQQASRTIVVTNRGLLIEAIQQLWLGAEIQLENPALGRKAMGRVVWWPSESSLVRANEIGIYMSGAEDFCGVVPGEEPDAQSPAADQTPPVQDQLAQAPIEEAPAPAVEAVAPVAASEPAVVQDAQVEAAPVKDNSTVPPAATLEFPAAERGPAPEVAALEAGAAPATAPLEDAPPIAAEAPAALAVEHPQAVQAPPQEEAREFVVSGGEKLDRQAAGIEERVLGSLEQKASSLEERLQSSRAQAESMLAKLEDLRERAQSRLLASATTLERTMLVSFEQQVAPIGDRLERSRVEVEAMLADLAEIEKRTQANLQESASRAEQRLVDTVEQQLGSVGERLEGSRAQVQALLQRLDELQKAGDAEVDRVRNAIPEVSGQAVQFALEGITERIRAEMETAGSSVVEETRERVHREGAAAIQAFIESGELEANLERVLQSQGVAIFGQFQKDSDHLSHQTVAAMQQKSDEIIRAASTALSAQATSAQGSLQALIASSSAELQRTAQQAMESASAQFAGRQKSLLNEAAENLRHTVDGLIDSAGSRMRQLAEANLELIDQKLAGRQKAFVDETVKAFREKLGEIFMRVQDGAGN